MNDVIMSAGLDGLKSGGGGGAVAGRLLNSNFDPDCLRPFVEMKTNSAGRLTFNEATGQPRSSGYFVNKNGVAVPTTNATLRKEEWLEFDAEALEVQRKNLVAVADLRSRGLTFNLANGLGTTVLEWQKQGDVAGAEMDMSARKRSKGDAPEWISDYLPLPIIHAGFDLDIRSLTSSRRLGNGLDTTMVGMKSRKMAEFKEKLLLSGTGGIAYGGGTIYGYTNHPSRQLGSLTGAWTGLTPVQIKDDVQGIVQTLIELNYRGPFVLYIPQTYDTVMNDDYYTGAGGLHSGLTIRERLLKIRGLEAIQVADYLPTDQVVMVQMTKDVVDLVEGLSLRTVEWDSEGGMVTHYKLIEISVPRIKTKFNVETSASNSTSYITGIAHYSVP